MPAGGDGSLGNWGGGGVADEGEGEVKVGSLFSGIGGFDLGLNLPVSWQVEQDKDCNRVLAHHWPETQRYHDVKEVGKNNLAPVDLICGGFPCQDLSVAGKRKGLDGKRSGLWFEFARIIDELEPGWVLIENVPGLLSSGEGRDFAIILQWLAGRGYCVAWRVFDSQYFGVAQRRKRVFVVASFENGRCAEVLFEPSCCCGDTPPGREAGEEVAGTIGGGSTDSRRGYRADLGTQGAYVTPTLWGGSLGGSTHGKPGGMDQGPFVCQKIADVLTSSFHKRGGASGGKYSMPHNLIAYGGNRLSGPIDKATACNAHGGTGRCDFESETFIIPLQEVSHTRDNIKGTGLGLGKENGPMFTLQGQTIHGVAVGKQVQWASGGGKVLNDTAQALRSGAEHNYQFVQTAMLVRRLIPTECLRLQGFPDDWLDLTPPLSDSAKYRMVGNAVTVDVIEWIGRRILEGLQ